jgi:hypothetical protein
MLCFLKKIKNDPDNETLKFYQGQVNYESDYRPQVLYYPKNPKLGVGFRMFTGKK